MFINSKKQQQMKKPIKKLSLNKSTISNLDASLMNQKVGGGGKTREDTVITSCLFCPTGGCPTGGCSVNCMSRYPDVCPDTV